jgi:hypothetical protein
LIGWVRQADELRALAKRIAPTNAKTWEFEKSLQSEEVPRFPRHRSANVCTKRKRRISATAGHSYGVTMGGRHSFWLEVGAPDRIRTCGLRLRRATLYPAELRVPTMSSQLLTQCLRELFASQKIRTRASQILVLLVLFRLLIFFRPLDISLRSAGSALMRGHWWTKICI